MQVPRRSLPTVHHMCVTVGSGVGCITIESGGSRPGSGEERDGGAQARGARAGHRRAGWLKCAPLRAAWPGPSRQLRRQLTAGRAAAGGRRRCDRSVTAAANSEALQQPIRTGMRSHSSSNSGNKRVQMYPSHCSSNAHFRHPTSLWALVCLGLVAWQQHPRAAPVDSRPRTPQLPLLADPLRGVKYCHALYVDSKRPDMQVLVQLHACWATPCPSATRRSHAHDCCATWHSTCTAQR